MCVLTIRTIFPLYILCGVVLFFGVFFFLIRSFRWKRSLFTGIPRSSETSNFGVYRFYEEHLSGWFTGYCFGDANEVGRPNMEWKMFTAFENRDAQWSGWENERGIRWIWKGYFKGGSRWSISSFLHLLSSSTLPCASLFFFAILCSSPLFTVVPIISSCGFCSAGLHPVPLCSSLLFSCPVQFFSVVLCSSLRLLSLASNSLLFSFFLPLFCPFLPFSVLLCFLFLPLFTPFFFALSCSVLFIYSLLSSSLTYSSLVFSALPLPFFFHSLLYFSPFHYSVHCMLKALTVVVG